MKKIIVADDDPGIRDIVRLILERSGYEVTLFSSAEPLLETNYVAPDLFLIDKQLPGMDGLDFCRKLNDPVRENHVPVIMLSAAPHILEMAKAAGATDALEKPFNIKELRDIVAKYIG